MDSAPIQIGYPVIRSGYHWEETSIWIHFANSQREFSPIAFLGGLSVYMHTHTYTHRAESLYCTLGTNTTL